MFSSIEKLRKIYKNLKKLEVVQYQLEKLNKSNSKYKVEIKELSKELFQQNKKIQSSCRMIENLNMQLNDYYIKEKNKELIDTKCENLLLTTYPETTTKNVVML